MNTLPCNIIISTSSRELQSTIATEHVSHMKYMVAVVHGKSY